MKRFRLIFFSALIIGGVSLILIFNHCAPEKKKSAEKNSYYEITSKLDQGGELYVYLSTEKVIKGVENFILKVRKLVETEISKSQSQGIEILNVFDFVFKLIKRSGLTEISGIGMSSITLDSKLRHTKIIIHHYKDKGNGLMWNLLEKKPHELRALRLLPVDTVSAGFSDFRINVLWQWIKKEVKGSGIPKLKEAILSVEPSLQKNGIDFNKLLDSLGGQVGYILLLDRQKKNHIPLGRTSIEIPEPALAIVLSVKNEAIFDLLQRMLPFPKDEKKNVKKIQIPIPSPTPITLNPVIVQKEGLLIFASNNKIVDKMFEVKKSGKGLISTDEFKKLSVQIPKRGNKFRFTSGRLSQLIVDIQKRAMKASGEIKEGAAVVEEIFKLFPTGMTMYGVLQNTDEGVIGTFNHNFSLEYVVLLPVTASAGIVAAIAIPNLLTALQKGKQKATMGDLKSILLAIESYIIDMGYAPRGKTLTDIKSVLEPFYIKVLPIKDAWGNDFFYKHGIGNQKDVYFVGSGGRDGVFDGFEQKGSYLVTRMEDFNKDIIISNGTFVFHPKVR